MKYSTAGLHATRLDENNPREVAFAGQWSDENDGHDLLWLLLSRECLQGDGGAVRVWGSFTGVPYRQFPVGDVTERDRIVVATMMQWLGSNVGFCFVEQSLRRCGYDVVKRRKTGDE